MLKDKLEAIKIKMFKDDIADKKAIQIARNHRIKDVIHEIVSGMRVIHDIAMGEDEAGQKEVIQLMLTCIRNCTDVVIDTAYTNKLEFSLFGRDLWYPKEGERGTLDEQPKTDWSSSSGDCWPEDD